MKLALLQTGKTTESYVAEGMALYCSRLKKYASFSIITVPELKNTKNMPVAEQKAREGKKILEAAGRDDFIVLLDEKGKELTTAEFAVWLKKQAVTTGKRIVFVVGGPWGVSEEVTNAAGFRLSLSKMTLPHQLIRVLFLEQLYRAFTIIKGVPYHHD